MFASAMHRKTTPGKTLNTPHKNTGLNHNSTGVGCVTQAADHR